jgi:hypothetical protein
MKICQSKTPDGASWERQPRETEKAYAAFECYLEMGDKRTITAVAQKVGKNRSLIDGWRGKFDWKERAREYDNFIVSGKAKKVRRETEVRYERLGRMSDQLTAFWLTKVKTSDPQKLSHREAHDYIQLGLRLADASRATLTLTEAEALRLDLELARLEASLPPPAGEESGNALIEALNAKAVEVWGEPEKPVGKEDSNDNEHADV